MSSLSVVEYEMFVLIFINGRSTLGYSEVTTVLVNYKLRKESYDASGEALVVRGGVRISRKIRVDLNHGANMVGIS